MERFRGGLVSKADKLLYHSTMVSRVIKKKREDLSKRRSGAARGRPISELTRGHRKSQFHKFTGELTSKVDSHYLSRSQWLQLPYPTAPSKNRGRVSRPLEEALWRSSGEAHLILIGDSAVTHASVYAPPFYVPSVYVPSLNLPSFYARSVYVTLGRGTSRPDR